MASVNSPIRTYIKPLLFKLMGKRAYKYAQLYGKLRDIKHKLVEEKEMLLLPALVAEGDTVLDIGANFAYYTERLSRLVGNSGKVIAFEPIPFTFEVCRMIVKKLGLKNVMLYNKGVADKTAQVQFSAPKLGFGGISAGQAHIAGRQNEEKDRKKYYNFSDDEYFDCQVVDLDSFGLNITKLTFVKIDIEGAELLAMKGMEKLLMQHRPVLLIEVQQYFLRGFGINENEFRKYITNDLGYVICFMDEQTDKLVKLNGEFFDDNFILLPAERVGNYQNLLA
jgi:FkbM family methyltransferase